MTIRQIPRKYLVERKITKYTVFSPMVMAYSQKNSHSTGYPYMYLKKAF